MSIKWPTDQIDILETAYRQFFSWFVNSPEHNITLDKINSSIEADGWKFIRAQYQSVSYDLQYDDTHPAYQPGTWEDGTPRPPKPRRCEHNPNFQLYPPGCSDIHAEAMFKQLAKRLYPLT